MARFSRRYIKPNAIGASQIADSSVTEGKIGTGAVTVNKIGAGAVTAIKIGTGAVETAKLDDDALAANAVGRAKMQDGFFTSLAVSAKFAAGSIAETILAATTQAKLTGAMGVLATASITCPSVVGGATDTTFTVQLVSPDGTNLAAVKDLVIKGGQASLTWAATTGVVNGGSGTDTVNITTDATGKFVATITNTDDESLYLYATSERYAGAGKGVVIIPSPLVTVTWAP